MSVLRADALVVGAGIAGASVAWELARRGATVVLLEREQTAGTHSTGRSAAVLTETTGPPVIRALAAASRDFLCDPPAGFTDSPLVAPRAVLWIATSEQRARLATRAAEWSARSAAVESLEPAEAAVAVPRLRDGYVAAAVVEHDGLDIDVDLLLAGYIRGMRGSGGTVVTGAPVTAVDPTASGWAVLTPAQRYEAAVVVNAAGAWADEVATLAGVEPARLVALRRTVFVFPPPAGIDARAWPLVMDADERFYLKPESGLLLASPGDETPSAPCDARPDELDVALGVERIEAAFDLEVRGVRSAWAGLRTFAPDRAPVTGADPDRPGFVWLAGQGGYGIKTAPALASMAAAAVLGEPPPADLARSAPALSPGRWRPSADPG